MDELWDEREDEALDALIAERFELAFRLFLPLAMAGVAHAQRQIGLMLDRGRGVRQDRGLAARWFRMAADQGDPRGEHSLAVCYLQGEGVACDPAEAGRWFRRAAQRGLDASQFELGALYEQGCGVPCDLRRAVHWYRLAALQNHADAVARLAILASHQIPNLDRPAAHPPGFRPAE